MGAIFIVKLRLLKALVMKFCIRIICILIASLTATHALSQDMSSWSDKTVCRLVESDTGAVYVEEAISRDLACKAPIEPTNKAKSYFRIKLRF